MESEPNKVETLLQHANEHLETRLKLFKWKTALKSADIISVSVGRIVLIAFVTMFVLVLTIAVGLYLGDLLGKNYYGFFILAGFYGLCIMLVYLFKSKWIETPVSNGIIQKMTNDEYK